MRVALKHVAVAALVLAATSSVATGVASSGSCAGGDESLTGRYTLKGLMGVGSTISLKADGSFRYSLTYGSLKQSGQGCWVQQNNTVALLPIGASKVANVQSLDNVDFRGLELTQREDGALVWDIGDSGRKAVYQRR